MGGCEGPAIRKKCPFLEKPVELPWPSRHKVAEGRVAPDNFLIHVRITPHVETAEGNVHVSDKDMVSAPLMSCTFDKNALEVLARYFWEGIPIERSPLHTVSASRDQETDSPGES